MLVEEPVVATMSDTLPIGPRVRRRLNQLTMTPSALVHRAGYANPSKGLRRLDELFACDFGHARGLIDALPDALEVPSSVIRKAIEDSKRQIAEVAEAAYRANFRPHAVVLTERVIPEPLHISAIIAIDQLKRIDFEPDSEPETYPGQALAGLL